LYSRPCGPTESTRFSCSSLRPANLVDLSAISPLPKVSASILLRAVFTAPIGVRVYVLPRRSSRASRAAFSSVTGRARPNEGRQGY